MATIMYSGIGTTDPVRGMHDGGMMHILRFYRPEKVYLFLTAEMIRRDRKDQRIAKTFDYIRTHWDGYAPQVIRFETPIEDPSDMDALMEPMEALLERMVRENPDAEILLNLSSGTPQMQIILAQMALDLRFPTTGIQVKSPERQSSTADRTNRKDYSVEDSLELNLDEEADVVNRCCVPKMMAINREKVRQQLYTLVDQRNYGAIAQMGGQLPAPYPQLARHLDCRSCFLLKEAEKAAEGLTGMQLHVGQGVYPYRVYEMVEFFAMLKHQVYLKEYTYFILRVNPLLVELQLTIIREKLDERGIAFDAFFPVVDRRRKVCPIAIGKHLPELLAYMDAQFGGGLREADLSIKALNMMLRFFGVDAAVCELLSACEQANTKLRNPSAHDLFAITNEDIKRISGMTAETMVARLEKVLTDAVARYGDRALKKRLNIYEHGDRLLKECL